MPQMMPHTASFHKEESVQACKQACRQACRQTSAMLCHAGQPAGRQATEVLIVQIYIQVQEYHVTRVIRPLAGDARN